MRKVYIRGAVDLTAEGLEFLPDEPGLCWEKALGLVEGHMGPDFAGLLRELRGELCEMERTAGWADGVKAGEEMMRGRIEKYLARLESEAKRA